MTMFLLSPANTKGKRADTLHRLAFDDTTPSPREGTVGDRLAAGRATFGDVFSSISSLYFRGKLQYGQRFAQPDGVRVIAPGVGLVPPSYRVTRLRWQRIRETTTEASDVAFYRSLARSATRLMTDVPEEESIVFLGGVSQERYLGVLEPILGARLEIPADFLGIGSMQRGSLLQKRARSGRALRYVAASKVIDFGNE